jgi:hypothetical protein
MPSCSVQALMPGRKLRAAAYDRSARRHPLLVDLVKRRTQGVSLCYGRHCHRITEPSGLHS